MMKYKHPPVIEATIGFKIEPEINGLYLEEIVSDFDTEYENSFELLEYNTPNTSENIAQDDPPRKTGFEFSNLHQTDIIRIQKNSLIFSRHAPYHGWNEFRSRSKNEWGKCEKLIEGKEISVFGLHYRNRIDIPLENEQPTDFSNYFRFRPYISQQKAIHEMPRFDVITKDTCEDLDINIIISSKSVPSPIIDCVSVVLDIGVIMEQDVPQPHQTLWKFLDHFRDRKNQTFNACITATTKELFEQ